MIRTNKVKAGEFVKAKIIETSEYDLVGEIIKKI
jgi:tRNA A37 methylthiotransferase MiaB